MSNFISIHAPTRGATTDFFPRCFPYGNFNPRSHKGSDREDKQDHQSHRKISIHAPTRGATSQPRQKGNGVLRFQSTLPQGERLIIVLLFHLKRHFNPRSHKGSDTIPYKMPRLATDFNPRSHKGSDEVHNEPVRRKSYISIHAPTRGATADGSEVLPDMDISIHAPTRGATIFRLTSIST